MKDETSVIDILKNDGVAIIPTDTIYGLVGKALSPSVVEKISKLKSRNESKPFIILISSIADLDLFDIKLNSSDKDILRKIWPSKVSVALQTKNDNFEYLHRGKNTLAFRMPDNETLMEILLSAGPLVAPSANPEGQPPAKNTSEAKGYFGDNVDAYIEGVTNKDPSTLISLQNGKIELLQEGAIKLEDILEKIK